MAAAAPPAALAPVATTAPATTAPETQLEYLCRNTQACVLHPYAFFVSWTGVLTLAFRGFPAPLVQLKAALGDFYGGLPKESPGSKWPKTSLACLKEGQRLSSEQLQRLNELCRQQSGIFQAPAHKRAQTILVSSLSTLVYETRCLERVISRRVVELLQPADLSDAPQEELARVQAVVAEADDADYWFHASRDGNREKHYRTPALGVTLVHEINFGQPQQPLSATAAGAAAAAAVASAVSGSCSSPRHSDPSGKADAAWSSALPGILAAFRKAVEAEVPGMYAWFDEASLHVTVRALIM